MTIFLLKIKVRSNDSFNSLYNNEQDVFWKLEVAQCQTIKQAEKTLFKTILIEETRILISTLLQQRAEWEDFRPSVMANWLYPKKKLAFSYLHGRRQF